MTVTDNTRETGTRKPRVHAGSRRFMPSKAIEQLPDGDIKLLQGHVLTYRLRVGDWRVLFSYPKSDTILVEKIGPRGQVYKEV